VDHAGDRLAPMQLNAKDVLTLIMIRLGSFLLVLDVVKGIDDVCMTQACLAYMLGVDRESCHSNWNDFPTVQLKFNLNHCANSV
jgi:hypothetical protein